jgi:hypothetical protein
MAIGVSDYQFMQKLIGPTNDIENFRQLLTADETTAILTKHQFISLINPTSEIVREKLTDYALSRRSPNDILMLYFSGHGSALSNDDFGFCTADTQLLRCGGGDDPVPIPLNLVRFSDVIETLSVARVDPVIVIDACYSGQAGERLDKLYSNMERRTKQAGNQYTLLCACAKYEYTEGERSGGYFSKILEKVARKGISKDGYKYQPELSLGDLFPYIKTETERKLDISPRYFQSAAPLEAGFVRNVKYKPNTLFIGSFVGILKLFWNDGSPKEFTAADLQRMGSTEHTTYSKLTYTPAWGLLEKAGRGKLTHLSKRGHNFMQNKLPVPEKIQKDPDSNNWHATQGAKEVFFHEIDS